MDFSSERSAEPACDRQTGKRTEPANGSAQTPAPAQQPIEWPIARGRINDPI